MVELDANVTYQGRLKTKTKNVGKTTKLPQHRDVRDRAKKASVRSHGSVSRCEVIV